jgi:pantoate--beta-alanine ligase
MKIVFTTSELRSHQMELSKGPSGFVPTMGALHRGHLSLVERAIKECPVVTVSIFVNPTQFNDPEDLKNYPRPIEKDIELLSAIMRENDIVFTPSEDEIYPEKDRRIFDFGSRARVMEGSHRPGHFNGVGQVLTRLFDIVNPDIAYFGQKDFQQVTIVRELIKQTGYKINIISCPVIREPDGLAMSSRNKLLEPEIRKKAGIIYASLLQAVEMAKTEDVPEIRKYVKNKINQTPGFSVEYFEIADEKEVRMILRKSEILPERKYFACIAVKAGRVRLIDNIEISLL